MVQISGVQGDGTTVEEGELAQFTVTLNQASAQAETVTLSLQNGTADASDYDNLQFYNAQGQPISSTLVFQPGETSKDIYVKTIDNDPPLNEPLEDYSVQAQLAGGNTDTAQGQITDSDQAQISINDVQVQEGGQLVFTVSLNQSSASTVSVNWQTALDNAGANPASLADFVSNAGTVTFLPGEISKQVVVQTNQDALNEFDETLLVQLSSAVGAQIADASGVGTILDDDGPSAGTASATVDEDGLQGPPPGIGDAAAGDWTDSNADGDNDETTFSGTLPGDVGANGPASFDFAAMHGQSAALGAETVSYDWNAGSNTLTASATRDGESVDVFQVQLDPASGDYTVTLLNNALHTQAGVEDDVTAALTYTVTDAGNATANGTLNVTIDDDLPVVVGDEQTVDKPNINLMVILDVSTSMNAQTTFDGVQMSQLEAAVASINQLFDAYDQVGNTAVRLVTFSSSAQEVGATWTTIDQARTLLAGVSARGFTNYRAALEAASGVDSLSNGSFGNGAWDDPGKLGDAINVSYFASDGNPNVEGLINGSIQSAWQDFLLEEDILSYALGVGNVNPGHLHPIAYDGRPDDQREDPGANRDIDAVVVDDFDDLPEVLADTIPPLTGSLFTTGGASATGGADGAETMLIVIDGTTLTFDLAADPQNPGEVDPTLVSAVGGSLVFDYDEGSNVLTATSAKGGEWSVELNGGAFTYQAAQGASGTDSLDFSIIDGDGDSASSSIDIDLSGGQSRAQPQAAQAGPLLDSEPLLATAGDDVFAWELSDIGTPGDPEEDTVLRFGDQGQDVLDLSDLLVDAHPGDAGEIGDLDHFLNISSDGTDSVVHISTSGGFSDGLFDPAAVDQSIVLAGVDLGDDSAQAIRDLLSSGQLIAD